MIKTLRSRLIISHITPLLLVLPLVGVALIYFIETQILLDDLSNDISREANLIVEAIEARPDIWENQDQANTYISSISVLIQNRVILIHPDGSLLATSEELQQPLSQENIQLVLSGQSSTYVAYGFLDQQVEVLLPVRGVNQEVVGIVGVTETIEGVASQFAKMRWWVLIIIGLELIFALVIGIVLATRLARPIVRSTNAVTDIAEGIYIQPLPIEGPAEIKQLAGSVNVLSEKLRILEESRRRSLANIVHELGRPLGAILSAVHVLRKGRAEDPIIRDELLEGMEKEINHMQPLLDDLAQLHGQVTGTIVLEMETVKVSDWLPSVLLPWRAGAIEKGIEWETDIPKNIPTIVLDTERMAQAIGNILSNAIKYTPEYGKILVSAHAKVEEIWIKVSDSGPGIAPDEQDYIFEPFYRSKQERRFPQGLGLGLTIARDLVEAHGGRLELESTPGKGSTFTITLPLTR
jgi:signal transduction histidine kinase